MHIYKDAMDFLSVLAGRNNVILCVLLSHASIELAARSFSSVPNIEAEIVRIGSKKGRVRKRFRIG